MVQRKRNPRFGRTGCLFWAFILLVIVVIFVFRGKGNLKERFTFIRKYIPKEEAADEGQKKGKRPESAVRPKPEPEEEKIIKPEKRAGEEAGKGAEHPYETEEQKRRTAESRPEGSPELKSVPGGSSAKTSPVKPELRTRSLITNLYFIRIDEEDGSVRTVPIQRTIQYTDSPITNTLEALLKGPTETERKKGLISFVPEGTRLLTAQINNGHLTLNFSSRLEENYTGRESILLELSQLMLTSFEFSQVNAVSILIDGNPKRYLTGEGIPLKEIYTKQDIPGLKPEG